MLYIYWSVCFIICPPHYVRSLRASADGERQLVVPASILLVTLVLAALAVHAISLGELVTSTPDSGTLERILRAAPPLVPLFLLWGMVVHALLAGPQALLERRSWPRSAIPVLGGAAAAAQGIMGFAALERLPCDDAVEVAAFSLVTITVWIVLAMAWGLLTSYPGRCARVAGAMVLLLAIVPGVVLVREKVCGHDVPNPHEIVWHPAGGTVNSLWALEQSQLGDGEVELGKWKQTAVNLRSLLDKGDPTARFCAAYAIGCLAQSAPEGSEEIRNALSEKLGSCLERPDEGPALRCACAYALGQLPKTEKVKMSLLCGAKADDEGVRWAALRSLGVKELRGDAIAEGVVEQGLRDPSLLVREEAKAAQARWSPAASSKSNAGPPAGLREDRGAPD